MKDILNVVVAGFLLIVLTGERVGAEWKQIKGPWGGDILAMTTVDSTIFAATNVRMFCSNDNGAHWTDENIQNINLFRHLEASGDTLYAASLESLYRSLDKGKSWNMLFAGGSQTLFTSIAAYGSTMLIGIHGKGIYRSVDFGVTWKLVPYAQVNNSVTSFLIQDTDLFAATTDGLYRSNDSGNTWKAVVNGSDTIIATALTKNSSGIFAGTSDGVLFSSDSSATWVALNTGLDSQKVTCLATNGVAIIAGTEQPGLFNSMDNGENWTRVDADLKNRTIQWCASNGESFFIGLQMYGVMRSIDSGASWTDVNTGISSIQVSTLSKFGNEIFTGTYYGVYAYNTSQGAWCSLYSGMPPTTVKSIIKCDTVVFAGTNSGVFRLDGNRQWHSLDSGIKNMQTGKMLVKDSTIFACNTVNYGLFFSPNQGNSWSPVTDSPFCKQKINDLMLLGDKILALTSNGKLFLSSPDGMQWIEFGFKPDSLRVTGITVDNAVIYAATNDSGIFRTDDNGATWKQLIPKAPASQINCLLAYEGHLFAGSSLNGVVLFLKKNGGKWINTGFPVDNIHHLLADNDTLYAAISNKGVWYRPIGELLDNTDSHKTGEIKQYISHIAITNRSSYTIAFTLQKPERLSISVYDLTGRRILFHAAEKFLAGTHSFNPHSAELSPGLYTCVFEMATERYILRVPIVHP